MRYYSFAGEARGKSDPDETFCMSVDGGDCDVHGCVQENCSHTVMMWSGQEYSKDHTWIAADENSIFDLDKIR